MKTDFSAVSGTSLSKLIPSSDLGWDRPFYIEVGDKLVACKFVKWYYIDAQAKTIFAEIKLANGMYIHSAELYFEGSNFYIKEDCFKIYQASDDILRQCIKKYYDKQHNQIKLDLLKYDAEVWMNIVMPSKYTIIEKGNYEKFVGWYWNGFEAVPATINIKGLKYDKNGLSIEEVRYVADNGKVISEKIYPTKSECEDDNIIDVVDFDDDEEESEDETYVISTKFVVDANDFKKLKKAFIELDAVILDFNMK